MARETLELEIKQDGIEMIKCQSGKWFAFSRHDLEVFITDTKTVVGKHILAEEKVGLFLDLDNANFLSLVLYSACINCGSTVIRCGISDLERQLPFQNDILLDWIICTDIVYRHIKNKIAHKKCILVHNDINADIAVIDSGNINVFEFYDMPNFIIKANSDFIIPGYDIQTMENHMLIKKRNSIENNQLPDTIIENLLHIQKSDLVENGAVIDYIRLNVNELVKVQLCGEITKDDNSIILNSIGMVELLVKVEEEFGIMFPIERITREIFENSTLLSELIFTIMLEK